MKIIFAGTPDFAAVSLNALIEKNHDICAVYTQPDRPAGRGRKLQPSPVKAAALKQGIPIFQPLNFKDKTAIEQLEGLKPDLMIVAAYGLLLPPKVLSIPKLGCINIHASLLPRWRGAAPIHRAILAGDKATGITIMQMDKGLDTGDMLHKIEIDIEPNETSEQLHNRLAEFGSRALLEALPNIENGSITATVQNSAEKTYAAKLEKKEAVIDWMLPAVEIERKIRAFNSWPVAQTVLDGKQLRIWQAEVIQSSSDKPIGTVIRADGKVLEVVTGEGSLNLLELQLPGKKRMPASALMNSRDLLGASLG
jgi:methionyl-tRNA formyltransferase